MAFDLATAKPVKGGFDLSTAKPVQAASDPTIVDDIKQGLGNAAAGLVRGAGSIGATIVAPYDIAKDALAGKGVSLESNRQRRKDIDEGLAMMGADPNSFMYQAGKLGGEVAGTAGAGGLLARGAQAAGASAPFVSSLASGGFSAPGANMLTRMAGGAANGAAQSFMVDPSMTVEGAVIGGAMPGAAKVAGMAGNKLASMIGSGAESLMQSAIKPTIKQLKSGDAKVAVRTLLDNGISPNAAGVNKLRTMIDDLNTQVADQIANSTATVDKANVLNALGDVRSRFANQVAPQGDLQAIQTIADNFTAHPNLPGSAIPVQTAQELKQGTYKVLAKKYGQIGSAETEAQKGLARGLKDEIANAVPGVAALNAQESALIKTLDVAERRALMDLNKNPMGLAALAMNPLNWAAFMADRSPAFKALAARMADSASNGLNASGAKVQNLLANPAVRTTSLLAAETGQ